MKSSSDPVGGQACKEQEAKHDQWNSLIFHGLSVPRQDPGGADSGSPGQFCIQ
jgi:hypothetical protein